MMRNFSAGAKHIYLACGPTDFRRGITGLSALVTMKFQLDPFEGGNVFIFCNKKKDAIKVLRYDRNGFILAHKKLLDGMRFRWPAKKEEVREITPKQIEWLLDGLEIEQKWAHHRKRDCSNVSDTKQGVSKN